jgi:DNA-binding CsgD family transcriptional regulator
MTVRSAETHRANIMRKLGARSASGLIRIRHPQRHHLFLILTK